MKLLSSSLVALMVALLIGTGEAGGQKMALRQPNDSPKYAFLVSNVSEEKDRCITAREADYDFSSLRLQPCDFVGKPKNQLWSVDSNGKIHSALDYDKCMIVDHGTDIYDGVHIKVARCNLHTSLNRFTHSGDSSKLRVFVNDAYCVTNRVGTDAAAGDTIHAKPCQEEPAHIFTYRA